MSVGREQSGLVYLDRDGTINVDTGYVVRPEEVQLIPGAAKGIALLKEAGFVTVIVSNQSAIGRGLGTIEQVEATNARIRDVLRKQDPGADIDGVYYCPHRPEDDCLCRKPRIGLSSQVKERWDISPEHCWSVGDKLRDLEFGLNLGIPLDHLILVQTGEGKSEKARLARREAGSVWGQKEILTLQDLQEAAEHIVQLGKGKF